MQELWVSGGFGTEDDDGEADDEDSLQHVAHSVGEGRDALQSVVGQLGKNTEKERATSMSGGWGRVFSFLKLEWRMKEYKY